MNYYLCKGYALDDYENCSLERIFSDMKSIEQIDMFTAKFKDYSDFRSFLIDNDLIEANEGIVIGNNKTKNGVKKLRPIFQKSFVFENDLEMLEIKSRTYKEIAKELWEYIKMRQNNKEFMNFILESYTEKYKNSKAPIATDIFVLDRIVNSKEKTNRERNEYEFSFVNFFRNSLFKCEMIYTTVSFDGIDSEPLYVFKPIGNEVNLKGLHDMLMHIIQYAKEYEYNYFDEFDLKEELTEEEYKEMELERICSYLSAGKIIQDCEKEEYMENLKRYVKENIL